MPVEPVNRVFATADASADGRLVGPRRCALLRSMEWQYVDVEAMRVLLDMGDDTTVTTLAKVAHAFDMAPSTVKNDWRDGGLPGRPGRWDLAEVLVWRIRLDARSKGRSLPLADDLLYTAIEQLAERFGHAKVMEVAERYHADCISGWDEYDAEEAAEAKRSRRRKT